MSECEYFYKNYNEVANIMESLANVPEDWSEKSTIAYLVMLRKAAGNAIKNLNDSNGSSEA